MPVLFRWLGKKLISHFFKKMLDHQVKKHVRKATIKKIDQHIKKIDKDIKNRTIVYVGFSLFAILITCLKNFLPVAWTFFLTLFLVLCFVYINIKPVKKLISIHHFIKNFDKNIKNTVKKEMEANGSFKQQIESYIKKATVLASSYNNTDIENLSISYSVREVFSRYKKYGMHILCRIIAYLMVYLLFQMIFLNPLLSKFTSSFLKFL